MVRADSEGRPMMARVGTDHRNSFTVRSEQRGHVVHLHIRGDLDMATSPVLEGWLAGAEANGNTSIIVDLENVAFMDATGLRIFLRAAERARRSGRRFVLVRPPPVVRKVLQITRTADLFAAAPAGELWVRTSAGVRSMRKQPA